ncbi:MAG: DUF6516 family protein [Candidatus Binatia bacterium]
MSSGSADDSDQGKACSHIGFVKGTIVFSQGLQLFIMEFVRTEPRLAKTKYRYYCQDGKGRLLFRYDDAPHHQTDTFLHHKHVRADKGETIVPSAPPSLVALLDEVISLNP